MHIQIVSTSDSSSIPALLAIDLAKAGEALLIDVRSRSEVIASGTARGAMVIPLTEMLSLLESGELAGLKGERSWVFVCDNGARSEIAAKAAANAGLDRAFKLHSLGAWAEHGGAISAYPSSVAAKVSRVSQPQPVEFV